MDPKRVEHASQGRHAVSAVISNLILTGAVIAVGFVVLFWAQYRSTAYNVQFSEAMDADIAKLSERLAFEYVYYADGEDKLGVYLMNCGTIDNVTVQTIYIKNSSWFEVFDRSEINLKFLNKTLTQSLNVGEEGYIVLSVVELAIGKSYSVRVVTGRGSTFEHVFVS